MTNSHEMFRPYSWNSHLLPGKGKGKGKGNVSENSRTKVVGWAYSVDPNTGQTKILFTRKVPRGTRHNRRTTGAAGTDDKYWGKYGSFGGTADRHSHHAADAFIKEMLHEGGFSRIPQLANLSHRDMILPGHTRSISGRDLLEVKVYEQTQNLDIFVVKFPWHLFVQICPPNTLLRDRRIFYESSEEIDLLVQLSMNNIVYFQQHEISSRRNNFFLGYAVDTLNGYVLPYLVRNNRFFAQKWMNVSIPRVNDVQDRIPTWDR